MVEIDLFDWWMSIKMCGISADELLLMGLMFFLAGMMGFIGIYSIRTYEESRVKQSSRPRLTKEQYSELVLIGCLERFQFVKPELGTCPRYTPQFNEKLDAMFEDGRLDLASYQDLVGIVSTETGKVVNEVLSACKERALTWKKF